MEAVDDTIQQEKVEDKGPRNLIQDILQRGMWRETGGGEDPLLKQHIKDLLGQEDEDWEQHNNNDDSTKTGLNPTAEELIQREREKITKQIELEDDFLRDEENGQRKAVKSGEQSPFGFGIKVEKISGGELKERLLEENFESGKMSVGKEEESAFDAAEFRTAKGAESQNRISDLKGIKRQDRRESMNPGTAISDAGGLFKSVLEENFDKSAKGSVSPQPKSQSSENQNTNKNTKPASPEIKPKSIKDSDLDDMEFYSAIDVKSVAALSKKK